MRTSKKTMACGFRAVAVGNRGSGLSLPEVRVMPHDFAARSKRISLPAKSSHELAENE